MPEPQPLTRPKVITVANQQGGVGKTTTAINLGAALAESGHKSVVVDLDPQGNASTGLGVDAEDRRKTTYDLLFSGAEVKDVVRDTSFENLYIVPATTDLSSADIDLAAQERRTHRLRSALWSQATAELGFRYVLLDCPPSLNLLTVNAMVAAHSVLVPLQSEFFALEGLSQLMLTVREIRQSANPNLRIEGVVLTMFDGRNNLSTQVEEDAREALGDLVFETRVPRNVRISEAPSFSRSVLDYDSLSKGSAAYRALARELLARQSDMPEHRPVAH